MKLRCKEVQSRGAQEPPNAAGLGWFRPARQRRKPTAMARPVGPVETHPALQLAGFRLRCLVPKQPSGRCAAWAGGLHACAIGAIKSHIGFVLRISSQQTTRKQKHGDAGDLAVGALCGHAAPGATHRETPMATEKQRNTDSDSDSGSMSKVPFVSSSTRKTTHQHLHGRLLCTVCEC